jgi:hypothetical protein
MEYPYPPYNEEVLEAIEAIKNAERMVKMAEAYLISLQEACAHTDPFSYIYEPRQRHIKVCRICGKELSNTKIFDED